MTITKEQAVAKIADTKGKVFGVSFIKSDKTLRKMSCRTGVRKGVKGVEIDRAGTDKEKGLVTVYDFNAEYNGNNDKGGFRRFSIDRLLSVQINGVRYEVV